MMRTSLNLSLIIVFTFVNSLQVFAETKSSSTNCSKIVEFKREYANLLNELKTKGSKVEVDDKGNIKGTSGGNSEADKQKSQAIQTELFNHYKNALTKVAKVFQQLKNDQGFKIGDLEKTNPGVAEFFKKIDPEKTPNIEGADNLKLEEFLKYIQSVEVKEEKYKLKNDDIYFIKKLMTHSQDVICSLAKLNKIGTQSTDYLQDTANNVISSLRKISKNEDLQLFDVKAAINESIKGSLDKMKDILNDRSCRDYFYGNLDGSNIKKIFGSDFNIQTCNYNKFLESLRSTDYAQFDTILHFMNANKLNKAASTDLNFIQEEFNKEKPAKIIQAVCSQGEDGALIVNNMPMKDGTTDKVDDSKLNCKVSGASKNGKDCLSQVNMNFNNGSGFSITPKDSNELEEFSIAGGSECILKPKRSTPNNTQVPIMENCNPDSCKMSDRFKDFYAAFEWDKDNNQCLGILKGSERSLPSTVCKGNTEQPKSQEPVKLQEPEKPKDTPKTELTDKEKCEKKNAELNKPSEDAPRDRYSWNESKKECVDKDAGNKKASESTNDDPEEKSSEGTNQKPQAPPARFVPVNIPQRQMYILPGMP
jgi:hypothetical protein